MSSKKSEKSKTIKSTKYILSTAEIASIIGVTTRTIQMLCKDKKVKAVKRGYYDLGTIIRLYYANQLEIERRKFKKNDMDINEARRRRESAEAELKEMELDLKKGEIVTAEEVKEMITNIIMISKTKLLAIPTAVSRRLLKKQSIREVRAILDNAIFEALDELSRIDHI